MLLIVSFYDKSYTFTTLYKIDRMLNKYNTIQLVALKRAVSGRKGKASVYSGPAVGAYHHSARYTAGGTYAYHPHISA